MIGGLLGMSACMGRYHHVVKLEQRGACRRLDFKSVESQAAKFS